MNMLPLREVTGTSWLSLLTRPWSLISYCSSRPTTGSHASMRGILHQGGDVLWHRRIRFR